MVITVKRLFQSDNTTISTVSIDGVMQCFGLENIHHTKKVYGHTRILNGVYHLGVRAVGGKHNRYIGMYPDSHQGMLHILNVPGFDNVLIHIGNFAEDTDGCLLLGDSVKPHMDTDYMLGGSRVAYQEFYNLVIEEVKKGKTLIEFIEV